MKTLNRYFLSSFSVLAAAGALLAVTLARAAATVYTYRKAP
jgi:hypothetical protein